MQIASFLRPRRWFNSSSSAASLMFCVVGSCTPRSMTMEGEAEIIQTINSLHPGNDDVSYCPTYSGRYWGTGQGNNTDRNLCSKYYVEKWTVSLTASHAWITWRVVAGTQSAHPVAFRLCNSYILLNYFLLPTFLILHKPVKSSDCQLCIKELLDWTHWCCQKHFKITVWKTQKDYY